MDTLFHKFNIRRVFFFTLLIISLSACGGGGGGDSTTDDPNTEDPVDDGDNTDDDTTSQNIIPIDVYCTDAEDVTTYIPLQSGDTITIVEGTPSIITYHDSEGTKRVCLDPDSSGSANIIRQ